MEAEPYTLEPVADRRLDDARRAVLARLQGCELVYAFGSRVTGRARADSDLDLAVLVGAALPPIDRFTVAQSLASDLGCEVDLVDLNTASTVLKKEIIAHGRLLFEVRPGARAAFEGRAFSDYVRLNEERRPILERIAREGSVFHG